MAFPYVTCQMQGMYRWYYPAELVDNVEDRPSLDERAEIESSPKPLGGRASTMPELNVTSDDWKLALRTLAYDRFNMDSTLSYAVDPLSPQRVRRVVSAGEFGWCYRHVACSRCGL